MLFPLFNKLEIHPINKARKYTPNKTFSNSCMPVCIINNNKILSLNTVRYAGFGNQPGSIIRMSNVCIQTD